MLSDLDEGTAEAPNTRRIADQLELRDRLLSRSPKTD
jgi:hypothetical protein